MNIKMELIDCENLEGLHSGVLEAIQEILSAPEGLRRIDERDKYDRTRLFTAYSTYRNDMVDISRR